METMRDLVRYLDAFLGLYINSLCGGWFVINKSRLIPYRAKNCAGLSFQIHSNSLLIYIEGSRDGGKKIPLHILSHLRISHRCIDGGSGG